MDWGNAIVRNITKSGSGDVTHIDMDLHLAGDFKSTEKKITWLSKPTPSHPLVSVVLQDYDLGYTPRYRPCPSRTEEKCAAKCF